jgi:hypothetical protein
LFDETYITSGGIRGGRLKQLALLSTDGIPYAVRFKDRPSLNGLFAKLATTFTVRYEKEPLPGVLDIEKKLSEKHCDVETSESLRKYLEELPAH